jgi:hypothetical protein
MYQPRVGLRHPRRSLPTVSATWAPRLPKGSAPGPGSETMAYVATSAPMAGKMASRA